MTTVERDKFLRLVSLSGIVEKQRLTRWKSSIPQTLDSPRDLALELVNRKLLTRWQAKMILKGAHRLRLGNYLLTDRVGKSDLGDEFEAVHQQLSRKVSIQYLAPELCNSDESKKKVFEFGSKLVRLDHPNLIHVYDIDEENERIYLVSESTVGKKLADINSADLEIASRARIISGCLKALIYAQTNGVMHGSISDQSIVVEGDCVAKIVDLTKGAVRTALSSSTLEMAVDAKALASIASKLLSTKLTTENVSDQSAVELQNAAASIANDPSGSLALIESWLAKHAAPCEQKKVENKSRQTGPVGSKNVERGKSKEQTSGQSVASPKQQAKKNQNGKGLLTRLAQHRPVAVIASSGLVAVLLICGTVFAASRIGLNEPLSQSSQTKGKLQELAVHPGDGQSKEIETEAITPAKHPSKPSLKKDVVADSSVVAEPVKRDSSGSDSIVVGSMTDPAVNKAAIAKIFGNKDNLADSVPETSDEGADASGASLKKVIALPTVTKTAEETLGDANETAMPTKPEKVESIYLDPGADPFKTFASTVDIPISTNTEQISFGKLVLEKKHLLGIEILGTELIHKTKPIFDVTRSKDDNQAWDVAFRKKRKSPPVFIAKLIKKPTEMCFHWLDEAKDVKTADYLRNCRLKLSTATNSHWLSLRKPIKIEGFKFTESGTVKVEVDIPFMPDPNLISASAGVIKVKPNSTSRKYRSLMYPAEITPGFPARMFFEEDVDRFLSIDIAAENRKKFILQAALVLQPVPNEPGFALDPGQIKQAMARVRELALITHQESERAKASKLKTDEKKVYADAARAMKGRAELTQYYEHIVPQLVNKDIPVTISYAIDGQHRIVLAQTVDDVEPAGK